VLSPIRPKRIWSCGGKPGRKRTGRVVESQRIPPLRTDEDTIDLVRRLPVLTIPDAIIAECSVARVEKPPRGEPSADKSGQPWPAMEDPALRAARLAPEGERAQRASACGKNWALAASTLHRSEMVLLPANKSLQALPGGYA